MTPGQRRWSLWEPTSSRSMLGDDALPSIPTKPIAELTSVEPHGGDRHGGPGVTRDPNHPLNFAAGIRYFPGANLARLEKRMVFDRLVRRTAVIEWLDDAPDLRDTLILRGLNHTHVQITPSTSSAP